ncbi:MAG: efflux RND transporter periplasmic adaptor subunit [Pseudomonadota bacterium]
MRQSWRRGVDVAGFLALIGLSVWLWHSRDAVSARIQSVVEPIDADAKAHSRRAERPAPVIVTRVAAKANTDVIEAVGTARAEQAVLLMAEAEGQIRRVFVAPGARVGAGQPVFMIDDTQANLAVQIAQKQLQDAQRRLKRLVYLTSRQIRSTALLEDAESAVVQAELALSQAENTLRNLTVRAPFGGVVGIPKVGIGDRVTTTTPVISLDDRARLMIEFQVPERFLSRIKIGSELTVETPGYRGRRFSGTVDARDSRVDPTSRFIMVRAAVPNPEDLLLPGMSFRVRMVLAGQTFSAVPELALQWRQGKSFIWVVKDKKAHRVDVDIVKRVDERVLIDGAVTPGMLVVVEGVQRLRPGRDVAVPNDADGTARTGHLVPGTYGDRANRNNGRAPEPAAKAGG